MVEPVNQIVDLAVGLFDLALELLSFSTDGVLKALVESKHYVHQSYEVIVQLLFVRFAEVDEADGELTQKLRERAVEATAQ
jgi:hypothetical protein